MRMLLFAVLWLIIASHVYIPNIVGLSLVAVSKASAPLTHVRANVLPPFFHIIRSAANSSLSFITEQVSIGGSMVFTEITCAVVSIITCGLPKFPSKSVIHALIL